MEDVKLIEELSSQINRNLKQVRKVTWLIKGYQLNDLGHVTHLNIAKCNLKGCWPAALFKLTHLQVLDIQENQLESIPEEIKELKSLACLDIRNNQIQELPQSISTLPVLQKLYLGNNLFTKVPELIQDCDTLNLIDFTDNLLSEGIENILNSTSIRNIYLRNNRLKYFPFHLIRPNGILELNVMENHIENSQENLSRVKNFLF